MGEDNPLSTVLKGPLRQQRRAGARLYAGLGVPGVWETQTPAQSHLPGMARSRTASSPGRIMVPAG